MQETITASKARLNPWIITLMALLPWAIIQFNTSVKDNVAWLSGCASRLMAGSDMLSVCYDTNPPLSIYLYAPPLLLSRLTGIPDYYCIYLLTFALIALSAIAIWKILAHMSFLTADERTIFTAGALAGFTLLPALSFAERDHIMVLGLMPFLLTQFCLTKQISLPKKLLYPVLFLGALAILIKPQFGLLPTILLLHRMAIRRKIFFILKEPDFIILAILTTLYTAFVFLAYPEFPFVLVPDAIEFYGEQSNYPLIMPTAVTYGPYFLIASILALSVRGRKKDNPKMDLLAQIFLGGAVCVFFYYLQKKGFFYHKIPIFPFFTAGTALGLYSLTEFTFRDQITPKTKKAMPAIACALIFLFAYAKQPPNAQFPTHQDYKDAPLTQFIEQNCDHPCHLLFINENMGIGTQTMFYQNYTQASRLPAFWFFPSWNSQDTENMTDQQKQHHEDTHKRFARYAIEDLEKTDPSLLMIMHNPPEIPKEYALDLFDFLSIDPGFAPFIQKYEKTGEFSTDRAYYYKNTPYDEPHNITWDIYKKKPKATQ
ncbi:MAG: hypothetical protein KDI13_05545 [Alphaproteobacteria bacterium]|nr:hypothetical protein [Alphaproteobacteria bacterium]